MISEYIEIKMSIPITIFDLEANYPENVPL